MSTPRARDGRKVLQFQRQRIGTFQYDHPRALGQRRLDGGHVAAIDKTDAHAKARQPVAHQHAGPRVGLVHADDVITGPHEGKHAGRDRRRARTEHQRVFGTFQRCQLASENLNGRVVAPGVERIGEFVLPRRAHRRDRREREIAGLVDRRRHCTAILLALFREVVEDEAQRMFVGHAREAFRQEFGKTERRGRAVQVGWRTRAVSRASALLQFLRRFCRL